MSTHGATAPAKRRRRSREEWQEIVGEFRRSGQTQRAFAERYGISPKTLEYWLGERRRLSERATTRGEGLVRLVPVEVRTAAQPRASRNPVVAASANHIEVAVGQSICVRFPSGADVVAIARFVRAVSETATC